MPRPLQVELQAGGATPTLRNEYGTTASRAGMFSAQLPANKPVPLAVGIAAPKEGPGIQSGLGFIHCQCPNDAANARIAVLRAMHCRPGVPGSLLRCRHLPRNFDGRRKAPFCGNWIPRSPLLRRFIDQLGPRSAPARSTAGARGFARALLRRCLGAAAMAHGAAGPIAAVAIA